MTASSTSDANGVFPVQALRAAMDAGHIAGGDAARLQPASLDLALGERALRLRASFLPGRDRKVEDVLEGLSLHEMPLAGGAVLETGCVYLVPLRERLDLPEGVAALANPKSSTGRLDVFTRVVGERAERFDTLPQGYRGRLWVEIAPRTFPILVRPGDTLVQLRLRRGARRAVATRTVGIDLSGRLHPDGRVGYRARRHTPVVDVSSVGTHAVSAYWDPLHAPDGELVLDPEEFYILASSETVAIPPDQAAEMAPVAPEIGEFRAHYAGFFDPGFGVNGADSRAVLEVRGRDVPFLLRHGQPAAKLIFEPMSARPDRLYGAARSGSNYQGQALKLGKHFQATD